MIFKPIQKQWVRREIKKSINNRQRGTSKNPAGILILCRADEVNPRAVKRQVSKNLERDDVEVIVFYDTAFENLDGFYQVDKKLIKTFGKIADEQIASLLKKNHEILINYFDKESLVLKLLSNALSARFKVGFAHSQKECDDIYINAGMDQINHFAAELKKILKVIK